MIREIVEKLDGREEIFRSWTGLEGFLQFLYKIKEQDLNQAIRNSFCAGFKSYDDSIEKVIEYTQKQAERDKLFAGFSTSCRHQIFMNMRSNNFNSEETFKHYWDVCTTSSYVHPNWTNLIVKRKFENTYIIKTDKITGLRDYLFSEPKDSRK